MTVTKDRSRLASAASGAASGVVVSACLQPLDVLRTRLQTDATSGLSQSWWRTMGSIAREGAGASNLWRGTSATVLRVGGGAAVHFYALQTLRAADGELPMSRPLQNSPPPAGQTQDLVRRCRHRHRRR